MNEQIFDGQDEHDHPASLKNMAAAKKTTLVSVVVNLLLSLVQIIAGIITKSQGLIADGIHSFSDLLSDFVVLFANQHSKKQADADHHYGHHRYENAASLVLGMLLLFVGIGMLWSAIGKIQNHGVLPIIHISALYVALISLAAKEILFRYMLKIAKQVRSGLLIANAWHARSDAGSSLVVAIGIIGNLWGHPIFDSIAALVVGLMVTRMGWSFSWDAMHDLMDRAATEEETQLIKNELLLTPGVLGIHDLRTRKVGDMIIVDVHLEIESTKSVLEGHDIAVVARKNTMTKYRNVLNVMTHVDPVTGRTPTL
jgi:cation diffusion facilitator family transporter